MYAPTVVFVPHMLNGHAHMLLLVLLMNTGIWKMRHHLFEWIPYGDVNYTDTVSPSVIGPGTTDYEFGYVANRVGLPNDAIDHLYVAFQQTPQIVFCFNMIIIVVECWFFLDLSKYFV